MSHQFKLPTKLVHLVPAIILGGVVMASVGRHYEHRPIAVAPLTKSPTPLVAPSHAPSLTQPSPGLPVPPAPTPAAAQKRPSLVTSNTSDTPTPLASAGHAVYPYHALTTPNDPSFGAQNHLATIGAPAAWNTSTGSSGTIIAIIDTGFALAHGDFAGRWYTNPGEMGPTTIEGPAPNCSSRGLALDKSCNNLDNDGDGYPSDWRGWNFSDGNNTPQAGTTNPSSNVAFHGTFVAGLAAATGNNGVAGAGVDWNARIMPLQALGDNGSGNTNTVAAAVAYAADHGAKVINLSLGSPYDDPYLHQQINYAIAKGAVVVAAAGNDGCGGCVLYPAAYPEVIAVGATNSDGTRASFSSYGAAIDLTAPGVSLCSTTWTSSNGASAFACGGSGTSFAAPLVSGAISLMLGAGVSSSDLARQYITLSADKVAGMSGLERTDQFGFGNLDVAAAVAAYLRPPITAASGTVLRLPCADSTAACQAQFLDANNTTTTLSSKNSTPGAFDYIYLEAAPNSPPPGVYVPQTATGNAISATPITFGP